MNEIKKFWIVWIPERGKPTKVHRSFDEAMAEACRLALKHTIAAYVCEGVGYAEPETPPVKWVNL